MIIFHKDCLTLSLIKLVAMIQVFHNPRCKKSRAGLQYVQERSADVEIIDYLKNPLTEKQLKVLLMKLNKKPQEMVRTQEAYYKSELKGQQFNDDEWIRILVENPKLIKRPIVVKGNKAIWGDLVEELEVLF